MKRPLFVILIGLVLGELSGYLFCRAGVLIPASLFLMLSLSWRYARKEKPFFYRRMRRQQPLILLLCAAFITSMLLGQISWCIEDHKLGKIREFSSKVEGEDCELRGKIIAYKLSDSGYATITIKNPKIRCLDRSLSIRGKVKLSGTVSDGEDIFPGDSICLDALIYFPQEGRNPGAFNEKVYDLASGVFLTGYFSGISARKHPSVSLRKMASLFKNTMEDAYKDSLKEEDSAMLCAMVFGDKSGLSEEQKKLYEENGVAHLLAISGLHVSSVGGRIYRFFRKRGKGYLLSCLGGAILLLFYGCMTGFGASVVRALCMFLIFLLAEYLGCAYDLISSMSLSGIMMILDHPYHLLEGGFLISYASVIAIGAILPFLMDKLYPANVPDKVDPLVKGLFSSLIIFCVTGPLIMRFYYECTPYSILLNPLVIPCMNPLMLSALLAGILALLTAPFHLFPLGCLWLLRIACLPALLILRGYDCLFGNFRKLPGALLVTGCPSVPLLAAIYLLELLCFWLVYKKYWKRMLLLLLLIVFLKSGPFNNFMDPETVHITMLDIGQGDCILIRCPGDKTILMDGGSTTKNDIFENVIRPALYYYGISHLDYVLVTHGDEDHISGIEEMLEAGYPVSHMIFGSNYYDLSGNAVAVTKDEALTSDHLDSAEQELCVLAQANGTKIHFMEKGDSIEIGDIRLSCLHPQIGEVYEDRNDKSLVFLMKYEKFSALFTGDLGSQQEDKIISSISSPVDLLKVGHHGSKYSSSEALLEKIQPAYAIISAGSGNRYGHPHSETLERLSDVHAKVFETLLKGAICIDTDGKDKSVFYWTDGRR